MEEPRPARSLPMISLPPRPVPWSLHLAALFGGFNNLFGWIFFGAGMIGFWIFGANADLTGPLFALTPVDTTPGVVLSVEPTDFNENDWPVYRIRFSYTEHGTAVEGVSYATGYTPGKDQRVSVERLRWDPTIVRVAGTRRTPFSTAALFVVVFPIVGLVFLVSGLWQGLRAARLLRIGRLAAGTLIGREATNTSINNRTVMKLTYEFTAHDGSKGQAVAKTHETEALEDEPQELLLYDPADPASAVMLDSLAGAPRIGPDGQFLPRPFVKTAGVLILPGLSLLGHGGYLLYRLLA